MNRQRRFWGLILSICIVISICYCNVRAAGSATVTLTNTSGTVGSEVTVSGKITGSEKIAAATVVLSYNQTQLKFVSGNGASGGSGSVQVFADKVENPVKTISFSMTFKIMKQGAHKLTCEKIEVIADSDMLEMSVSKSGGTITGNAPTANNGGTTTKPQTGKDSNNKLSSLQVYPGTLEPAFNADNTAYSVNVSPDTTSVTISVVPQSSKATVTVTGGSDLKLGPNLAQVVVVAENGTSRAYNITIMCGEVEKIPLNGMEYTINESFADEQIPKGFTRTKVTYNEREYEALGAEKSGLKLINLQNELGADFYIYDAEKQEFFNFIQVAIAEGKYIIVLPLSEDVKLFQDSKKVKQTIFEKEFETWQLDEEFGVAYVMTQEGEKTFYRYDSVDGVFQRYVEDGSVKTNAKNDILPVLKDVLSKKVYYLATIAALAVLSLVLLIVLICTKAKNKQPKLSRIEKVQQRMEKKKAKKLAKEMKKTKNIEEN